MQNYRTTAAEMKFTRTITKYDWMVKKLNEDVRIIKNRIHIGQYLEI
jgi:hypothetical protein